MYQLQPQKKSNGCVMVFAALGAVALVVVALLAFAVFVLAGTDSSAATYQPTTYDVTYMIATERDTRSYCYDFDTTYEMPSGTAQRAVSICNGAATAIVDRRVASRGDFVYLSVQNDEFSARISCEIYVNGMRIFQTYSEGQYVIASCSGSIP